MFWLFSAELIQLSESQFLHQNASNYYILAPTKVLATITFDLPHDTGP